MSKIACGVSIFGEGGRERAGMSPVDKRFMGPGVSRLAWLAFASGGMWNLGIIGILESFRCAHRPVVFGEGGRARAGMYKTLFLRSYPTTPKESNGGGTV